MKSHVLLTIGLFLVCAPAPDARDISEFTSNFIVPQVQPGLSASEPGTIAMPDRQNAAAPAGDETSRGQPGTEATATDES